MVPTMFLFLIAFFGIAQTADVIFDEAASNERIYFMKRCGGAGCPYTASWLSHINLYRTIPWWLESTKMEAASFNMYEVNL
jgi:hypothetical protein